jgi:hypothetical protein
MTDIVHQLLRYMASQLQGLPTWDAAFAVCFVSETEQAKQVERYPYIDEPNPDPLIVTATDHLGTYIYIRELTNEIDGGPYTNEDGSSCGVTGVSVRSKFRAVAVAPNSCFAVELATVLVQNIQNVDFSGFTRYQVEDVRTEYVAERSGLNTLYEIETGCKPMSYDMEMAAFDFDLRFDYETSCNDELPNIC